MCTAVNLFFKFHPPDHGSLTSLHYSVNMDKHTNTNRQNIEHKQPQIFELPELGVWDKTGQTLLFLVWLIKMHWFFSAMHAGSKHNQHVSVTHALCLWTHRVWSAVEGCCVVSWVLFQTADWGMDETALNTVMLRFGYWLPRSGHYGNACYRSDLGLKWIQ